MCHVYVNERLEQDPSNRLPRGAWQLRQGWGQFLAWCHRKVRMCVLCFTTEFAWLFLPQKPHQSLFFCILSILDDCPPQNGGQQFFHQRTLLPKFSQKSNACISDKCNWLLIYLVGYNNGSLQIKMLIFWPGKIIFWVIKVPVFTYKVVVIKVSLVQDLGWLVSVLCQNKPL